MRWSVFCSLLLLASTAPAARAAAPAARDSVYLLPRITVEARRSALERDLALRPGFSALYLVDDLPSPSATTADVLAGAVGVHVRQFGGLGSYSAVSVRGSNANQVAFYLDGVPLNQAQYGVLNPSDLPLAALDHVEVYRGTAPLAFDNPGGGVVNLVTRTAPGARAQVRGGYGSFASRRAEAWGTRAGARARLFGAARYEASHGDFLFLDDNGTPLNPADDERVRRRNNAYRAQGATAKLDMALGPRAAGAAPAGTMGRLSAAVDVFSKRAGMPGISSYQSSRAGLDSDHGIASFLWTSPAWLGRALALETQLHAVGARDRFHDPDNELASGRQDTDDRTLSWGARQRVGLAAGPLGHSLEALVEARREQFRPRVRTPVPWTGPASRRATVALGLEERLEPRAGQLTLSGSLRREAVFDAFPAGAAYAGLLSAPALARTTRFTAGGGGARLRLGGDLVLRVNAARAVRAPSLFELFGNRGAVLGNRALLPERLINLDAGLAWARRWSGGEASAELAAYTTRAHDLILFVQNSQRTSVAENVSAARLRGVELSAAARRAAWRLSANWTRQRTRDASGVPGWQGRELPGRPADEISTRVEWATRRWRAFHELQYVARNFLDRANRDPVPARWIHDLGLGVTLARRLRLTAELKNATDDRVQDVAAYPLPGRAWYLTAEGSF